MDGTDKLRLPPQSIEAEQAVIGGVMLAPDAFPVAAGILSPEDFYRGDHQLIFSAFQELAEKGKPLDAVTVGEWFEALGLEDRVGGGAYLIEISTRTPSAANIAAYAQIVKDKALQRKLIEVGTDIVNSGFSPDGRETPELLADAMQQVFALAGKAEPSAIRTGRSGLRKTMGEIDRRMKAGDNLLGLETSLPELDELLNGFQPGLIVIAARPSMGKTALMLQMRRHAAMKGHRPYTISMEMSGTQVYMRDIAAEARVDYEDVQRPHRLDIESMDRISRALGRMESVEWWLDDEGSMTINQIASRIRRMKKQHDIGIAFIDYLQLIDISRATGKDKTVATAIQEVTRLLKKLSTQLEIPIVILSQLNRGLESRNDKRPNMSDLRESGAIEQDADVVIFLHRQGYFEKDWSKDDPRQLVAEINVAKARNGKVDGIKSTWLGRYQRFETMTNEDIPDEWYEIEERRQKRGGSGTGFQPHLSTGAGIERSAGASGKD